MNVTTIVTNILSTHNNNTIPTTQAVYEYAAAAADLNNDVTYTLGMTNTSASLATLRNRSTSAAIHPETEAAAVLTNTPGKTLDKALSSGVSYTEGSTGGVSADNLSEYYSKTQVDELLAGKLKKPANPTKDACVHLAPNGYVGTITFDTAAYAGTLARRTAEGRLRAADPADNNDLTTKKYVDNLAAGKQDKPSKGSFPVYLDLSGAADDLVCQYKVPGAQWRSNSLAATISEVFDITNHFSTGPQQFEAGKSYLCFYAQGLGDKLLHASVLTIGSDGNSVTIGEDYPIRFGGRVKTPRGSVYEMSRMPTSPTDTRFSDFITTTFGKWPLIRRVNGTTWFQGLSDCELTLRFNTSRANCAIGFLDCCNLTVLTDTSGMPIDSSGSTFIELYLRRKNLRFLPIGSTYFGARTSANTETANQQVAIATGTDNDYAVSNITLEGTMADRPTYYPDEDGGTG